MYGCGVSADLTPAQRFRLALDMHELGVALQRQRLRRERPEADEGEIEQAVGSWLLTRPGAEGGDAIGKVRSNRS